MCRRSTSSIEIAVDAFFDLAPSHLHYARVRVGDGPPVEHLLTDRQRRRVVATDAGQPEAAAGTGFAAYLGLGVEHILAGFDHIAFLLALLLLCRHLREVVLMVTGFTLGHSLTLSLAVLGVVEPNVPVIEALIGFTIALVAAENIGVTAGASRPIALAAGSALAGLGLWAVFAGWGPPPSVLFGLALFTVCYLPLAKTRARAVRLRPTLTVLFGLIHGFGFASVLMEIGLPRARLASALFGFNIGVEFGQLAIIAGLWLLGRGLAGLVAPAGRRLAFDAASAGLCALGVFWFVERLLRV